MPIRRSVVVLALALLSTGCVVSNDGAPQAIVVVSSGTLIVDWTVNQSKEPDACRVLFADTIQVTVRFANGAPQGTYVQVCPSFATTILLDTGTYSADAVLVDAAGNARTTTVAIAPFTILGNDQLTIPIDFPVSSFF